MKGSRAFWTLLLLAAAGATARYVWQVRRRSASQAAADLVVTEASEASFPASDPPSFTPVTGPRV